MSNIRLFESTSTSFYGLGLGKITDAISCTVTEERNGIFELEMEYPVTGMMYKELCLMRLIVAPTSPHPDFETSGQAFRIYSINKDITGHITVHGQHISYDLSNVIIRSSDLDTHGLVPKAIWDNIIQNGLVKGSSIGHFTFTSNLTANDAIKNSWNDDTGEEYPATEYIMGAPRSVRNFLLGTDENCLITLYEGADNDAPEYKFDNFNISLLKSRGSKKPITIRYGQDLTSYSHEESMEHLYTHVYPYFYADSMSYNKEGNPDKDQITKDNFIVDLSNFSGASETSGIGKEMKQYKNFPFMKTGIKKDSGEEYNFMHVLPLDCSSLYDGKYAVTFTNRAGIGAYNQHGFIHPLENIVFQGKNRPDNVEFTAVFEGFHYEGIAKYPIGKYTFDLDEHLANLNCRLTSAFYIDSSGAHTYDIEFTGATGWDGTKVPYCKMRLYYTGNDDLTLRTDYEIAEFHGDGSQNPDADRYIDLDDQMYINAGVLQIKRAAERYIKENNLARFPVDLSIDVRYDTLNSASDLNTIKLCDTITVLNSMYDAKTTAKCTKTVYDVLNNAYTELEFSNTYSDFAFATADSIERQNKKNNRAISKMNSAIKYLTFKAR